VISIVMAVHNGADYLEEQLQSILIQNLGDFELLVGDDVSTDNSWEILKGFAKKDPRIRLFRNEHRMGFVRNFENLLKKAQGDFIALSDQDDRWYPQKLERQMQAMLRAKKEGKEGVLIHSDLALIDEGNRLIAPSYFRKRSYHFPQHPAIALMLSRSGVMGNTVLMDRKLLEISLPFPAGIRYHDWWLGTVAEVLGYRITLTEPLVAYRIHTQNNSGKSRWLAGEMRFPWKHRWLPFHDTERIEALEVLLERMEKSDEHSSIVKEYLRYLKTRQYWIRNYRPLRKKGFFAGTPTYRLRIMTRIAIASLLGAHIR